MGDLLSGKTPPRFPMLILRKLYLFLDALFAFPRRGLSRPWRRGWVRAVQNGEDPGQIRRRVQVLEGMEVGIIPPEGSLVNKARCNLLDKTGEPILAGGEAALECTGAGASVDRVEHLQPSIGAPRHQ